MKFLSGFILSLVTLTSFAQDKSVCDHLLHEIMAVSGAFQNVAHLDSLLDVDARRLAACGSWDPIDQQIMNRDYLKEIIIASLKDRGEFPTYGEVLDIFDKVKNAELYPAIRLSKETYETLSGKIVDWDNLEEDKIKAILITEEEFNKFKTFLNSNKFAGEIGYAYLLDQYYSTTE
ncbi:MAG: hypothetical protein EOP54_14410 [Sphingobacteriales bacterium]|nr:MAG: hypothetical protein EOP54_14410 [Sphingobacteriales bacterium]